MALPRCRRKGGNGPQGWMPYNVGMFCAYAKMWIAIKWQWNLSVATSPVGSYIFPGQTAGMTEKGALQYALSTYCRPVAQG